MKNVRSLTVFVGIISTAEHQFLRADQSPLCDPIQTWVNFHCSASEHPGYSSKVQAFMSKPMSLFHSHQIFRYFACLLLITKWIHLAIRREHYHFLHWFLHNSSPSPLTRRAIEFKPARIPVTAFDFIVTFIELQLNYIILAKWYFLETTYC